MSDIYERGSNISLGWLFVLGIIELVLIWIFGSQLSYLVIVNGYLGNFHLILVFGVIIISTLFALTIALTGLRMGEKWGSQRCKNLFGMNAQLIYKSEIFILVSIVLGTLIGTGFWDIVTVLNALSNANWNISTFNEVFVVFDFMWFKIEWFLWVHLLVGSVKGGLAIVVVAILGLKIKDGSFCEV